MKKINFSAFPEEIHLAAHAIGLDYKRPYIKDGRKTYKPYKNCFFTHKSAADLKYWLKMEADGYAERFNGVCPNKLAEAHIDFRLTRAGLDWLGKSVGVVIE